MDAAQRWPELDRERLEYGEKRLKLEAADLLGLLEGRKKVIAVLSNLEKKLR